MMTVLAKSEHMLPSSDVFKSLDRNGDGVLSIEELSKIVPNDFEFTSGM